MGLLDKVFSKKNINKANQDYEGFFKTMQAYAPVFTDSSGGVYEMELTRAAIDRFATICGKLKPQINGNAYKNLEKILQYQPNPYMNTYQFLYRIATILKVNTTAFIIPLFADDQMTIIGFYPLLPSSAEVLQYNGEAWLRYHFATGETASIEMSKVGILTQFQYESDFFGGGNAPLFPTMNVINIQKQGMVEGIKQSAVIRFMAKLGTTIRPEDLEKERRNFSRTNLDGDANKTGVMMFDNKYSEVKQIDSKPFIADAEQMKLINDSICNYFGMSEKILQNNYTEEEFNSYFESAIEPFALQLSLCLTNMLFTQKEKAFGNEVIFTSNRFQYMSNTTKLSISTQMFDRGLFSTNMVMDMWGMAHVPDGDKRFIRQEYTDVDNLQKIQVGLDTSDLIDDTLKEQNKNGGQIDGTKE